MKGMKKISKILALCVAVFMIFAFAAGCVLSENPIKALNENNYENRGETADPYSNARERAYERGYRPGGDSEDEDEQDDADSRDETSEDETSYINVSPAQEYWINGTCAVYTAQGGCDVTVFGCQPVTTVEDMRRDARGGLRRSWGVNNQEDLDDTIRRLVEGMHNPSFLKEAEYYGITEMTEEEFKREIRYLDDDDVFYFQKMFDAYNKFGERAIMAWDLSRATQLCEAGYTAGYYTYDEAMLRALEVGKIIQQTFDSWDDFFESYLLGYAYWSEDEEQYDYRTRVYNRLKADPKSPFLLDWNLDLNID